MAVVFRPTDATAVKHAGFARKLGNSMGAAPVLVRVFDGYIFRAVRAGPNVLVTTIDPDAYWLFLHWDVLPGLATNYLSGMQHLARQQLVPLAPTKETSVAPVDETLDRLLPNASHYISFDAGSTQVVNNMQSVPRVTRNGATAALELANNNLNEFTNTRYQVIVSSSTGETKLRKVGVPFLAIVKEQDARDMFFRETALQSITGDFDAKLQPRQATRYTYSIPTFGAQVGADCFASRVEGSIDYNDVVVGGAYVSQPNSSNTVIAPEDPDPARLGIAGVWIARFRRWPTPFDPDVLTAPAELVWDFHQLMTADSEPELRPGTYIDSGQTVRVPHAVEAVAIASQRVFVPPTEADGAGSKGWVALFYTLRCNETEMDTPVWRALKILVVSEAGGAMTLTVALSVDAEQYMLGPETLMFGAEGIVATRFNVAGGVMDQASVRLIHVDIAGAINTSTMDAAGWYPFTDYLLNPAAGGLFGQVNRWAVPIGNNKIAVVARNTTAPPLATSIEYHLVVVDATTGAFIEVRSSLGLVLTVTPLVHLSVVTPEVAATGTTPLIEAVLVYTVGNGHYRSTDGGRTWQPMFSGTFGTAVYLGNQFHRVTFEETI